MAAELKPCPFCGSKNAAPYSVKSCHSVLCVACGGEGPEADSEEGAIAAWNLRTPGVMACDTVELTRLADAFERSADWLDKGVLTGSRRTHPLVGTADYLKAAEALRAAAGVAVGAKRLPMVPTNHMMNAAVNAWHSWKSRDSGGNVQLLGRLMWEHMADAAPEPGAWDDVPGVPGTLKENGNG